jgi:hypothetical protein
MADLEIYEARDEVYLRLLVKQVAEDFVFNDFIVEKTYRPYSRMEDLAGNYVGGKVYVVAGTPGDLITETREPDNISKQELAVVVGYQRANVDFDNTTAGDLYLRFIKELETMCRKDVGNSSNDLSFRRLEYLKDENGVPLDFFAMRNQQMFEAYFTVFYDFVLD